MNCTFQTVVLGEVLALTTGDFMEASEMVSPSLQGLYRSRKGKNNHCPSANETDKAHGARPG